MKLKRDIEGNVFEQLLKKDPEALKHMIHSYSTLLFQVAFRITGNKRAAEEVLCDVFRDLWENPFHYERSRDSFLSSYLIKLCKLKCVNREEIHITKLLSKKSKNYIANNATI